MKKFETNIREDIRPRAKNTAGFDGDFINDFPVSYTPIRAGVFNIYLFGVIYDPRQFISAIEVLQAAGEDDVVVIHLSTDGGSLDATDTFLSAMQDCEAKIVMKASGGVHSAGSVILLHADEFYLSENFNCLIHNGSCGVGGKYSDFKAQSRHTEKYMESTMRRVYEGFLTEDEIQAMIDGKDFWLDAEEFGKRFEARQKHLGAKIEAAKNEILAAMMEAADKVEQKSAPKRRKQKAKVTE